MRSLRDVTKLKRQVRRLMKRNAELREYARSLEEKLETMKPLGHLPDYGSDDITVDQDGVPVEVDRSKMFLVDYEAQQRRHLVDSGQLGRHVEEPVLKWKVNSYDIEFLGTGCKENK